MLFRITTVKKMKPEHKKQVINTLKRELGSAAKVSEFSEALKVLQLIDLSDDVQLEAAVNDGSLMVFLTHYSLGIIPKLIEIKYRK